MAIVLERPWFVYIILCDDNSFYTGIAIDVQKRFIAHQSGKGARYTKIRGAQKVLYTEPCANRTVAAQRELRIKALTRMQKEQLIQT